MNKVYVNKDTNMVEQILKVGSYDELPDDYFSNCYAVMDEEEKINAYNLKYDKETNKFEEIEGLPPKDEVIIIEKNEDIEQLKKENEELKKENESVKERLKSIEETLNKVVEGSALNG